MQSFATTILAPWANFYIITGSAAAALTGLMFVVITLVSGERMRRNPDGITTFSTPTVVHFGSVLLVSAIVAAPWRALGPPAVLLGIAGLCGIVYVLRIMHKTRHLSEYTADAEDWIWYTALPLASYAAIVTGAILLSQRPGDALFADAAGVMLLIFIGIHNSWDIVTYIAIASPDDETPVP
jgi:hypothetical protein